MADLYQTKFYKAWANMKTRCSNKNIRDYYRYGGRGITFYDKWKTFGGFFDDMYGSFIKRANEVGEKNLSLDRINNNGNYEPNNCRWATLKEQANNRKSSRIVEWNGMKKTIVQWAEYAKVKSSTFKQRFYTYKWNINKCITYDNE